MGVGGDSYSPNQDLYIIQMNNLILPIQGVECLVFGRGGGGGGGVVTDPIVRANCAESASELR